MAIHHSDITQQLTDYRGVLGWNSWTDPTGASRKAVEVELFCKEHSIPIRKPKFTEVNTLPMLTGLAQQHNTGVQAIFWGAPDILQASVSGWIITPYNSLTPEWLPKALDGTSLGCGNLTYGEYVLSLISGFGNTTPAGAPVRKDPNYYVDPYGHKYDNPIIAAFESQLTTNPRKQTFSMTLYLES